MKRIFFVLVALLLVFGALPSGVFAADTAATPADWDVPNGHFYSQTGGGGGWGYIVSDQDGVRFWSEFKRLGGVNAVGYPASQRFEWDGYTVQVFQKVIFQWHPDSNSVAFVNVFDRLHDLGKDPWLLTVRQTPNPASFNEQGMSWNQVVANRLKLLDAQPAIKAKYYAVVGDPIQANGLPTSPVTDMGNAYVLRAQRVVFQLWKQDVPWAKAGTVTVALGGDIAKEAGILPDPVALRPVNPSQQTDATSLSGYGQWLGDSLYTVDQSLTRFDNLLTEFDKNHAVVNDPNWIARVDVETAIWRKAFQDAQAHQAPASVAQWHQYYVSVLRELNEAASFSDALHRKDGNLLQYAFQHLAQFAKLWNDIPNRLPPGL